MGLSVAEGLPGGIWEGGWDGAMATCPQVPPTPTTDGARSLTGAGGWPELVLSLLGNTKNCQFSPQLGEKVNKASLGRIQKRER